ncbi:MAG: type III-E CRISPR-associated protein Csx30 [Deltaproteobacteria bacterium]
MITTELEFSQTFDLLLKYGQISLETDFTDYRDELATEIRSTVAEKKDNDSIIQDISNLEDAINAACEFWKKIHHLVLSRDDESWSEAQDTFRIFDWSNYFSQAVFELKSDILNFHPELSLLILKSDELVGKVNDILIDDDTISMLRMVPLNSFRQWKISLLPENCRYMYPWYETYSELPDTFLASLAENWKNIGNGDVSQLETPENLSIEMIFDDLKADKILFQSIESNHHETILLKNALKSMYPHRLWNLSEDASFDNPLLEGVYEKGLIRLAIRILDEKVTPDEIIGQIFWVAFCGAGLSDKQRLENFKWVMPHIEKKCYVSENSIYLSILGKLQNWVAGESKGFEFANTVYKSWNEHLFKIANQHLLADVETDESEEQLINRINQIKAKIQIKDAIEDFKKIWESICTKLADIRSKFNPFTVRCAGYAGVKEKEYTITYGKIPARLSIESIGGKIQLPNLPADLKVLEEVLLEEVLKDITEPYYSFGFSWNVDGEMKPIEEHNHDEDFNREIDDQFNDKKIQEILLVLEFDEKELKDTMKTFTEWIANPDVIKPPELKNVIVLYYSTS